MKTKHALVLGLLCSLCFAVSLLAQVPRTINYQGKLNNPPSPLNITFRIFDAASGGNELWSDTYMNVPNPGGIFNVALGDKKPFPDNVFFEGATRYLEIEVIGRSLKNRVPFTSVAYALRAAYADNAPSGSRNSLDAKDGDPANAVFVDSLGNVGVGATVPQSKLHLVGNETSAAVNRAAIRLEDKSVNRAWTINAFGIGSGEGGGKFAINQVGRGTRFMIDTTGAIGIGTLAPSSKLHVVGGLRAQKGDPTAQDGSNVGYAFENDGDTGFFSTGGNAAAGSDLVFRLDNAEAVRIVHSGGLARVGIGASNPLAKLHISSPIQTIQLIESTNPGSSAQLNLKSATDGYPHIVFTQGATNEFEIGKVANDGNFYFNNNAQAGDANAAMVISPAGDVGIGTTGPDHTLDVNARPQQMHRVSRIGHLPGITNGFQIFKDAQERYSYLFDFGSTPNSGVGIGKLHESGFALDVNGKVRGLGAYDQTSDLRYKKNLATIPAALDKIIRLRGVSFDWRRDEFPDMNFSKGTQLGFIAQEIKEVLPEVVSQDSKGFYSVAYSNVVPVLVEAMKEQQNTIVQLQTQVHELTQAKSELQQTRAELVSLKERMQRIEALLAAAPASAPTDRSLAATGQ